MASVNDDDVPTKESPVRRTRSGRAVKTPAPAKPVRKTRKKMVMVEVEVSDEEQEETPIQESKQENTEEQSIESVHEKEEVESEKPNEESEKQSEDIHLQLENSNSASEVVESMYVDGESSSQQFNEELSSDPLNNQVTNDDSNSVPQSERQFNAFASESTQDQFEHNEVSALDANDFTNAINQNMESNENTLENVRLQNENSESTNKLMDIDIMIAEENNAAENKVRESNVTENDVTDSNFTESNIDESNDKVETTEELNSVEGSETIEKTKPLEQIEESETSQNKNEEEKEEAVTEPSVDEKQTDEPMEVDGQVNQTEDEANPDTEVISEDELPSVQAAKVPETEEVSDDELPGPKLAELPADTEVVSEDELPTVKKESNKRKLESNEYDPGSPTSETEAGNAAKRQAVVVTSVESEKPAESEKSVATADKAATDKKQPHKLPELDKYWKAVNDDPTDFTGWTYLLQYVDQVNEIEAAREAYDAFLSHYPYCYGYWRKYADYEKRKGNKKKCEEVFERGLKAIPLSVDLWLHFLNYTKSVYGENEEHVREQFERALTACGLEFRSDRLWDTYINWELEGKRLQNVTAIYDRLLATPTQGYTGHFDNFQEFVATHAPNKVLDVDEFLTLRKEVRHMLKHDDNTTSAANSDIPPGEEDASSDSNVNFDEETKALRERIVSVRRKLHKVTVTAVTARWTFEEGIKRPYFHVKPLERCQLKNWKEYLDYEIEHGDRQRIIILFERCLIACALYEEFWLRYVRYLEDLKDESLYGKIREVYERACTIHHVGKPPLHLAWAMYEEATQNHAKASEILVNLEKSVPNLLQVAYRRINLERRRSDFEKCSQLYESYMNNSKNKIISTNMAIKYARFCLKVRKDPVKAVEILLTAVTKDPTNPRLHLQLIDVSLQKDTIDEKEVVGYIDQFLEKDGVDAEQKVLFAQRKLEFLEDFGSDIQNVQKAYDDYQKYCKLHKEGKKKKDESKSDAVAKKKSDIQPPLPTAQSNAYSGYGAYSSSGQNPGGYSQYGSQPQGGYGGQYSGQYNQSDQYNQYQNWQYSQSGYGNYNQWGNYGNYY